MMHEVPLASRLAKHSGQKNLGVGKEMRAEKGRLVEMWRLGGLS